MTILRNMDRAKKIEQIFSDFLSHEVDYVMLRGSADLLPDGLDSKKDIDILVSPKDQHKVHKILKKKFFFVDIRLSEFSYLYGVDRFRYYRNIFYRINIDICYQLTCQSLNSSKEVVPLDKSIQGDIFLNIDVDKKFQWKRQLSLDNQVIYELPYSLFNKYGDVGRLKSVCKKFLTLDSDQRSRVEVKLGKIFFGFTPTLIRKLSDEKFESLYKDYKEYQEY